MSNKFHNVLAWGEEETHLAGIQRKFLQYFKPQGSVLDLGSGRGVFLDLLREGGFEALGVEMDKTMYEFSRKKGHAVEHNDALSYLRKTKQTFDGILASHIIEHLPMAEAAEMVELIKKRLNPGGVAIVITPRPGSLWATENFWLDTTHIRPYPYELMRQMFAPLSIITGGIEPDSNPLLYMHPLKRLAIKLRKPLLGGALYDFAYGGGVSYIVAQKDA